MRESRKFCQRGSNFDVFFVGFFLGFFWGGGWGGGGGVDDGREDPNTTISGPSLLSCQCWPNIESCYFEVRTNIAKKLYIFVIFQGGPDPLPPSGSAHVKQGCN